MNAPVKSPSSRTRAEILTLAGADCLSFARAQFASSIEALPPDEWRWTAWLDAAGKVRALAMAWRENDALCLLLRGGRAEAMRQALQPYVLRARVTLATRDGQRLRGGNPLAAFTIARHAAGLQLGLGGYSLQLDSAADEPEGDMPTRAAIAAGHPWLPDQALGTLLPPALNLYALGAVTLGKGCYPGQEMANRLHLRGGHKYGLVHWRTRHAWQPGQSLMHDGRARATVLLHDDEEVLLVAHCDAQPAAFDAELIRPFSPATA